MAEAAETCAECGTALTEGDRVAAGDRVFCRSCYAALRAELERGVADLSSNVNYVNAAVGALLGGLAGALAWWAFTALTHIAVGLLAIAIGFLAGWGAVKFSGGKRSTGLQAVAIVAALASSVLATYLVNVTLINQYLAKQGDTRRAGVPASFQTFFEILKLDFGIMDVVFVAIAVYYAWKVPRPITLPPDAAA